MKLRLKSKLRLARIQQERLDQYKPGKMKLMRNEQSAIKQGLRDAWRPDAGRSGAIYRDYLQSPKWISFRIKVRKERRRCEDCGRNYGLTVHHLRYDNLGNEKQDDVVLLCWPCHQKRHPEKATLRGSP